jgi:hypothetical protein
VRTHRSSLATLPSSPTGESIGFHRATADEIFRPVIVDGNATFVLADGTILTLDGATGRELARTPLN